MNRRTFLSGLTAAVGVGGWRGFAGGRSKADLTLGVVSDLHLVVKGDEIPFRNALRYFREQGVDAVVVCGDIADRNDVRLKVTVEDQLRLFLGVWNEVFPNGRAPDGRKVERVLVTGNHDDSNGSMKPEEFVPVWERVFGEKYETFFRREIKGYTFLGAQWQWKQPYRGLPEFMAGQKVDPTKPFFFVQHQHPKGTCFGVWGCGNDRGVAMQALDRYPNAVVFSGHSHYPLTDERSLWQGAFTSVNAGSLRYASHDYSLRENGYTNSHGYRGEKRKHLMGTSETHDSAHGLLLRVYGGELVFERKDFKKGAVSLGSDWCVSVPPKGDMTPVARAARRAAPEFASDAVAKAEMDAKRKQVIVSFPGARPVDNCRAFEYEVTATLLADDVDLVQSQRRVLAADYHLPPPAVAPAGSCVFALDELPLKGDYRFSVRPVECLGRKGAAIETRITI